MSYRTSLIFMLGIVAVSPAAESAEVCKGGLVGISLVEGSHNPPGTMAPDTESLKPSGKWPDNLVEQGWHNLRKAERPLHLVCRYSGGQSETMTLSPSIDTCVLRHGLVAFCE
jgi:hypothetical protein